MEYPSNRKFITHKHQIIFFEQENENIFHLFGFYVSITLYCI
jgi:hypothetical protein